MQVLSDPSGISQPPEICQESRNPVPLGQVSKWRFGDLYERQAGLAVPGLPIPHCLAMLGPDEDGTVRELGKRPEYAPACTRFRAAPGFGCMRYRQDSRP